MSDAPSRWSIKRKTPIISWLRRRRAEVERDRNDEPDASMIHAISTVSPALVVAVALVAGILCQIVARHLRIPGIVLLLAVGVVLGPDFLGVVQPDILAHGLDDLIGFAVAVILFEGGLNLNLKRLRREARVIQRLLTIGVAVTFAGAATAAHLVLGWAWAPSLLFGSLVIVTGPTVITPLIKRVRVSRELGTILEAEGVLVDAIGAVVAVVMLEVVIAGAGQSAIAQSAIAHGLLSPLVRLGLGLLIGVAGGALLTLLLRTRHLVPEGLANALSLAWVFALFQISNALVAESGVVAAIGAGMVVGNTAAPALRELKEFKEQLTVLLIGLLFVLLAADVRLESLRALGWPGLIVVGTLMFVVRPLSVTLCTWGSNLGWRHKVFLSWVAPRGIVAAAIASLFREQLGHAGLAGGDSLRALVFLVIAGTVFMQGATAAPLARLLGLRRPSNNGYAILGAHPLACMIASGLREGGEDVVLLDANADAAQAAQAAGHRVIFGNALEDRVQLMAQIETRRGVVGILANTAVNRLFAQTSRVESRAAQTWVAIQGGDGAPDPETIAEDGTHVLFGAVHDVGLWNVRIRRKLVVTEVWDPGDDPTAEPRGVPRDHRNLLLPLLHLRDDRPRLVDETTRPKRGDQVVWLVLEEAATAAHEWLTEAGWHHVAADPE